MVVEGPVILYAPSDPFPLWRIENDGELNDGEMMENWSVFIMR